MSEWIDELKNGLKVESENKEFSKNNLGDFIEKFIEIAETELAKINDEFFGGKPICRVSAHAGKSYFDVIIGEMAQTTLLVKFEPNKFIKVTRQIATSGGKLMELPEVIAIKKFPDGYRITFEPELIDGRRNTTKIGEQTLARMLVEPALRQHFNQPQVSYEKDFNR